MLQKIENRETVMSIIGLGYVGLPLAVEFAREGYKVIGIDVIQEKVDLLNSGKSYIPDVPESDIAELVGKGLLKATTDFGVLQQADAISICVPTPLSKTKDPDMSYVDAATREVAKHCHQDLLIVLESTTYPGTTDELIVPQIVSKGFKIGEDVFVCFSPERIDPGNDNYGVRNTPKVMGGVTPDCTEIAVALYSKPINQVIPVSSTRAAEMVKLLENTFRLVNIGLVNEMAVMCDKLNVNVWEVIDAASTKPFGFMTFYPGPGLGGHCIPIDPLYLSWKMKAVNYNARFIELASAVNGDMPLYVIGKVIDALNEVEKSVKGSNILVLGVAYKRDINDLRESPALDVIRLLQERGAAVSYCDPHIPDLSHENLPMKSVALTTDALHAADCVVIVTDHTAFDYDQISSEAHIVIDSRNALKKVKNPKATVVRL
jgi:UDP-N-acetyl-D-glucosamine dehydrogenase